MIAIKPNGVKLNGHRNGKAVRKVQNGSIKLRIKVFIVEPQPIASQAIRRCFQKRGKIEVVGCCGSYQEALRIIRKLAPDIVLFNPVADGALQLEGCVRMREANPGIRVVLRANEEHQFLTVPAVLGAGAQGLLPPDWGREKVMRAVLEVASGTTIYIGRTEEIDTPEKITFRQPQNWHKLSAHEKQVQLEVNEGRTTSEIAEVTGLSPRVTEDLRSSARRKLRDEE